MDSGPAIEVSNLHKTYSDGFLGRKKLDALRGISFTVDRGEIFGLLGPNGAGKTTFIKLLLGIVRKTDGAAALLGMPAGSRRGRQRVGYLPENLRMPPHLTGYTALEYFGQLSNVPLAVIKQRSSELLELVGLADRAKDKVSKYSKGMVQRLGLAQALLHEPDLLVLDEPTDGLDPVARNHVRSILTQLKKEKNTTIFLNSHILQEVELICDRVAILDKGELRYIGSVADVGQAKSSEFEVDFEVVGEEAAVRTALDGQQLEPTGTNSFRFLRQASDQAAIDQVVDALRGQGVSIIGLARRRMTLENAFLDLLSAPSDES